MLSDSDRDYVKWQEDRETEDLLYYKVNQKLLNSKTLLFTPKVNLPALHERI